jgi:hypothetical protein
MLAFCLTTRVLQRQDSKLFYNPLGFLSTFWVAERNSNDGRTSKRVNFERVQCETNTITTA